MGNSAELFLVKITHPLSKSTKTKKKKKGNQEKKIAEPQTAKKKSINQAKGKKAIVAAVSSIAESMSVRFDACAMHL